MSSPPRLVGMVIGFAAMIVLAAADVLFVLILQRTPINFLTPVWVGLILLSLPVIAFVGYRTTSLLNARYLVTRNALVIVWGPARHIIPMGEINNLVRGRDLPAGLVPRGLWWPGCLVGRGHSSALGDLAFFATAPQREQIVVATDSGGYVISPASVPTFVADFEAERKHGITEPVERAVHLPSYHQWGFWRDRWAGGLIAFGLALPLLLMAYVAVRYPNLPAVIPLHYNSAGQVDRLGPATGLFILPAIGGLVWLVNSLLGGLFYVGRADRLAAYLLWAGAALVQVFLWIAAIGLV